MPWHRSRADEHRETLALLAIAESTLREANARLERIKAEEAENVRLDALDATVRARTIRAELERGRPDAG